MNKAFQIACEETLEVCRELYNAALSQRISAHKLGRSVNFAEQSRQLTQARELPEVGALLRSFQVDALRRLDYAYQGFFRRVRTRKGVAGFPRFKSKMRYDSFGSRDARDFQLSGDKLTLRRIGSCRVRLSRALQGRMRTVTVSRAWDGWYVSIACDNIPLKPLPVSRKAVGIDLGLESFAVLSTGESIANPRYYRKSQASLSVAQRRLSLKTKGSKSRIRARRLVSKFMAQTTRQRDWFHWQQARAIVSRFGRIAVEDLRIRALSQSNLGKSIHDAGWGLFIDKLFVKAEEAAREVIKVSAKHTSQDCSRCGRRVKKDLSERWHSCPCGLELSRDHNAAINILGRAVPDLKIELAESRVLKVPTPVRS